MKRFFIQQPTETVVLDGNEHTHLSRVLRLKPRDEVILCCGDGYDYRYRIERVDKNSSVLTQLDRVRNLCEPRVHMTVFSALMKGDKPELAAQKLTELGVNEIVLMTTKYAVPQNSMTRRERVERTCMEAAKQCGRAGYPKVDLADFSELPERLRGFDAVIFPYEKATEYSLSAYLSRLDGANIRTVAVVVGAEGGFADEEAETLIGAGVTPVTLGKRILRAETANIVVAALVMNALGEYA